MIYLPEIVSENDHEGRNYVLVNIRNKEQCMVLFLEKWRIRIWQCKSMEITVTTERIMRSS